MKIKHTLVVSLAALMTLSGCRFGPVQYKASAMVSVDAAVGKATLAQIDSEVEAIRAIAPAWVSPDWRYNVQPHADTSLIEISVTAPNAETAADSCNRIAEKYTGMTNGVVVRRIVEKAPMR